VISLTDLKAFLGITVADHDTFLTFLEAAAVAFVQTQTKRYFGGAENRVDYCWGDDLDRLVMRDQPRISPVLTVVSSSGYGMTTTTVVPGDTDGYILQNGDKNMAVLLRKGGFVWDRELLFTLTYDRGYDTDTEPADIRNVVLWLVALAFNMWQSGSGAGGPGGVGPGGLQSERLGDYAYVLAAAQNADDPDGFGGVDKIPMILATLQAWKRYDL
jgi:hypothetical protein